MSELAFLADMNISHLTAEELRRKGWDIIRVSEVMNVSSSDLDVLEYARTHDRILITQDLDFSTILAVGDYDKPSVINLRLENASPANITKRIMEVVSQLENELTEGVAISVEEVTARYRKLPLKIE